MVHLHLGLFIWPGLSHSKVGVVRTNVLRGNQDEALRPGLKVNVASSPFYFFRNELSPVHIQGDWNWTLSFDKRNVKKIAQMV